MSKQKCTNCKFFDTEESEYHQPNTCWCTHPAIREKAECEKAEISWAWTNYCQGKLFEPNRSPEKLLESIRKTSAGANEKLMLQAEFYAAALAENMPFQPDIWTGGSATKTRESHHLRLIWKSPDEKFVELFLADNAKGFFDVNGNRMSIVWIATEDGARDAFRSAFRFIFGGGEDEE